MLPTGARQQLHAQPQVYVVSCLKLDPASRRNCGHPGYSSKSRDAVAELMPKIASLLEQQGFYSKIVRRSIGMSSR